jgi:hypothetical protein
VALPIEQFICMRDKGDSLDNGESIDQVSRIIHSRCSGFGYPRLAKAQDDYEIQIYSSDPVAQKTTMLKLRESKRKKRASLKIIVENTTGGAWVPGSFT